MSVARRAPKGSRRPPLVTLSTDLGWAYAAQMKAVLYASLPRGSVVDLAHDLPAHNLVASSFLFREMAARFPAGTVHVGVVDPGVGGKRAPVAVRCRDGSFLVGPDNGLLAPLAERLHVDKVVRLRPAKKRVGATFDGRDLFAPSAAQLAAGRSIETLGTPHALRRVDLPTPRRGSGSAEATVLWVDPFGNLITNVPSDWLPARAHELGILIGTTRRSARAVRAYEELPHGALGVLPSSSGLLEIAVRESSAAELLDASAGDPLRVEWSRAGPLSPSRAHRR
ncbi:MAG: SAM-dependent chlorinase/fluorinase [Thermoplasmata archaeon]|nr:SAM-dependent chlorinase/fluorinase [Thermoplasmata archaeon]